MSLTIDANNTSGYASLNTHTMFNLGFVETDDVPIDTYITKIRGLIILIDPGNYNDILANLVVLGTVSAFESYIREVIRKTIIIDNLSQKNCETMPLSYGAAMSHQSQLLPEAILEEFSFAGKKNVVDSIKHFLNFKGNIPDSLDLALNEFSKVCEIRHCLVHRFGKLGTKNAIKLGLSEHSKCIEKPLLLDYVALQNLILACNVAVKEVNNYIFNGLLNRLITDERGRKLNSTIWKWNYNSDRLRFSKYYRTFVSTIEAPINHSSQKDAYDLYRNFYTGLRR